MALHSGCGIAFSVNDAFADFAKFMLRSFWMHNKEYNGEFLVLTQGLSPENIKVIEKECKQPVQWVNKKVDVYVSHEIFREAYLKLEIYNPNVNPFDKLILVDTDMLICKTIIDLFSHISVSVGACRPYERRNDRVAGSGINSGFIYLGNRQMVNDKVYQNLIARARRKHKLGDQSVLNAILKPIYALDKSYNVESRMIGSVNFPYAWSQARIKHFVAETKYGKLYKEEKEALGL